MIFAYRENEKTVFVSTLLERDSLMRLGVGLLMIPMDRYNVLDIPQHNYF
jgi:hypothetical protein